MDSSIAFSRTRLALGVKGISTATKPDPRPTRRLISSRASRSVTPYFRKTRPPMPDVSAINPNKICSVPTKLLPIFLASSCAVTTTLIPGSVNLSNILLLLTYVTK